MSDADEPMSIEVRRQCDEIYARSDDLFLAGRFAEFDAEMESVIASPPDKHLLLTYCVVSRWPPKGSLPSRERLYELTHRVYTEAYGPERTERILQNLRPGTEPIE